MKRTLPLLALMLAHVACFAQNTAQKRIEFDLDDQFDNEKVFPFGEYGFIIASHGDKPRMGNREWKYDLYDTDLGKSKSVIENVPERYRAPIRYATPKELISLYHRRNGSFLLHSLRADDLSAETVSGKIRGGARIKEMEVLNDYVYLSVGIHRRPFLVVMNRKTGSSRTVPIKLKGYKDVLINHIQALEESNELYVYLQADKDRKVHTFAMRFDNDGKQVDMLHLKDKKKQIKYATAYRTSDTSSLFMGTYSTRFSAPVEGIYVCKTTDNDIDTIRYHNFASLKNFQSYLSERRLARMERKKAKRKAKGKKTEPSHRYYVACHEVVPVTEGYLFIGELYYPTYRTETYTTGNGSTVTRTVFDGFQYTSAFVAKFNYEGDLLWDQAFAMYPSYKPMRVELFLSIGELTDESVTLAFSNWNRVISQTISLDGQTRSETQTDEIKAEGGGNQKIRYSFSDVVFWYGDYFLAHGTQTIKNPDAPIGEKKRKVFFVNRVAY